jgi:hypothetical protein
MGGAVPPKREGPGRPEKDDEDAVRYVLQLRRENPKIGHREAARRYFKAHPEKLKAKLESEARRVGDKAARWMTLPTPSERERLKRLEMFLIFGAQLVRELLERWEQLDKGTPPRRGDVTERIGHLEALFSIWPGPQAEAGAVVDSEGMDNKDHFDPLSVIAERFPEAHRVVQDLLNHLANPSDDHAGDLARLEELNRKLLDAARRSPPLPPTHY